MSDDELDGKVGSIKISTQDDGEYVNIRITAQLAVSVAIGSMILCGAIAFYLFR